MEGRLKKIGEQWHIMIIEECDWITYYPIYNQNVNFAEGDKVSFELVDEKTHPELYKSLPYKDKVKYARVL